MRVTSELWVQAAMRRVFSSGGFAAVERRGAREAGAIFIIIPARDGTCRLFGPAPQAGYDQAKPQDRLFQLVVTADDRAEVDAKLEKEARFDPDLWVIEIEADAGLVSELLTLVTP
jgi:hypothetical protein